MSNSSHFTLTNLDAATIPLTGRHLIEASAGTGKTYNITRIYLRLLLERELKVEEILLMTFTKDATQELRGRIDAFIREALSNWESLCEQDPYFQAISSKVSGDKIQFLLKRALLFLDEAAIFTIHGFCQRALTQHAFASGLPFNANMSTNSNELFLEATQDWYRQLAKQNAEDFGLLAQFWATPSTFVSSFSKAISHRTEISLVDVQCIVDSFTNLAKQAYTAIVDNNALLAEGLIAHKKADEQENRAGELVNLTTWLKQISECQNAVDLLASIKPPMPDYLLDGRRHPKAFKVQLAQVLSNSKTIKDQLGKLAQRIQKAQAYQLVRLGVYQIRAQVQLTKERLNCLDFDDLINTLADNLQSATQIQSASQEQSQKLTNNRLAQTLLAQYPVALIDEFQDTDPQQFAIIQGIYYPNRQVNHEGNIEAINQGNKEKGSNIALYLIGDPKQAIYGFRGGDIFAYLNARSDCDYHWLMDTNWRSTPNMVAGYNQLFLHGKTLGNGDGENPEQNGQSVFGYGIDYQAVLAGKKSLDNSHKDDRALQFIHFVDEDGKNKGKIKQSNRPLMATWCANEIVNLLNHEHNVKDSEAIEENNNTIKPRDIAILVRDGREANDIKEALLKANLASVFLSDRANLFYSEQAKQLIQLLKGILAPEDERLYLSALACGLLGFDAVTLYKLQQNESAYQALKFNFFDYREQWQRQGFISMAINLMHQHFDFSKANMKDKKARALTNLLHLFEILQSASQKFLQPQELLYWFEQQCNEDNKSVLSDLETEQRLESDGDLIRIVTQHGSKGLEYPIVFIPFATRHKDPTTFGKKSIDYLEYHNDQGKLCLSLAGDEQANKAMANEAYAESIRLLYVAVTRAERRCYILTTAFEHYALSPLGKTLQWQPEQDITQSLQGLVEQSPESISLTQVSFDESFNRTHMPDLSPLNLEQLQVSKFVGKIERDWWLSSFSALSKNLRHGGVSSPDRDSMESIEDNVATLNNNNNLLRFQLAKGAHSGNLLHDILEHCNFKNHNDDNNNLLESIKWPLVKYGELAKGFSEDYLVAWLDEIVKTPLTHSADSNSTDIAANDNNSDNFCLSDIDNQKTIRESEFYFPMEKANIAGLSKLLTDHRNTDRQEKSAYQVRLPNYKTLKGMMHGFIDLVFEHQGKFYVCDYKSSHLGDSYADYNNDALRDNIEQNYYDLQYLIYSLALHRYLKHNLADYDVSKHFGGIYYLYLRGMTHDEQYKGMGIYYRQVTATELNQLDSHFKGENRDKGQVKQQINKEPK